MSATWAAALVAALLLVASPGARAGPVGTVLEAGDGGSLSVEVSRHAFDAGTAGHVVLAPADDADLGAVAAGLTGLLQGRAPLLLTGDRAGPRTLEVEIDRVTGGPDAVDPPVVWLLGTANPGLGSDGYDVRTFEGGAAEVAGDLLRHGAGSGTARRVLLFSVGDWQAGAVAAAFGAAAGVPVVPVPPDGLPDALDTELDPARGLHAVAVGGVAVPEGRFAEVTVVDDPDPGKLSALMADLVVAERPAGFAHPTEVRPVAADGYGDDAAPALLGAVVSTLVQDEAGDGPLLLVAGRPATDPQAACDDGARDAASSCALAAAPGPTTVLALTGTGRSATAPDRPAGPVTPPGGTLPATGGVVAGAAGALALAVGLGAIALRRRSP